MRRQYPFVQGHLGAFIERSDTDRELLAAVIAVIPARSHRSIGGNGFDRIVCAAEGAIRSIGPADKYIIGSPPVPAGFSRGVVMIVSIKTRERLIDGSLDPSGNIPLNVLSVSVTGSPHSVRVGVHVGGAVEYDTISVNAQGDASRSVPITNQVLRDELESIGHMSFNCDGCDCEGIAGNVRFTVECLE